MIIRLIAKFSTKLWQVLREMSSTFELKSHRYLKLRGCEELSKYFTPSYIQRYYDIREQWVTLELVQF